VADPAPPIDANSTAFIVRTDAGARKIVERLDGMRNDLAETQGTIESMKVSVVRWDRLIFILGAAASVIVGASWRVMNANLERSDRMHAEEMRVIREELMEVRKLSAYVVGSYQVNVEKKAPAVVAKQVREATGGEAPPTTPTGKPDAKETP
jgi:hypothetical protein